jgi:hypothetical protein
MYSPNDRMMILRGQNALKLMQRDDFQRCWSKLQDQCIWGTVFQGIPFTMLWYSRFRTAYEPLIAFRWSGNRELVGLWCLAVDLVTGQLVSAGAEEAEYQCWLSSASEAACFVQDTFEALLRLSIDRLTLHFAPPALPLLTGLILDSATKQPFINLAQLVKAQRLRKSSTRSKVNRLKECRGINLEHIQSPERSCQLFSSMTKLIDDRRGRVNGLKPFSGGRPEMRQFCEDLGYVGVLHSSVLWVGDKMVSVHIDFVDRDQVILGFIGHDDAFGIYSPGKIHMLMLCEDLFGLGYSRLDLTPEGEYKDRFATAYQPCGIVRWNAEIPKSETTSQGHVERSQAASEGP